MAGPAASLGELARQAGLVDAPSLERLVVELRERLRAGRPTSLARLLVERGIPAPRVLAAIASGGQTCSAVRCDACGATYPVGTTPPGREFPCQRCGALLVGLGARATPPAAAVDDGRTVRFQGVLPLPGTALPQGAPIVPDGEPNEEVTISFSYPNPGAARPGAPRPVVPGAPAAPALSGGALHFPDDGDGRTMQFDKVLALPGKPATPARSPDEESDGRTVSFDAVLPIPGAPPPAAPGFPPALPAAAASAPQSGGPAAGPFNSEATTQADPEQEAAASAAKAAPSGARPGGKSAITPRKRYGAQGEEASAAGSGRGKKVLIVVFVLLLLLGGAAAAAFVVFGPKGGPQAPGVKKDADPK